MRKIVVTVRTDKVGSLCSTEIEVEDDTADEDITEQAQIAMFDMIEWDWKDA